MYGIVKCLPTSRRKSISRIGSEPVEVVDHQRRRSRPGGSRGTARAGRGSRRRWPRASRDRAGSARSTCPTGRRSCPSRRRRGRPAGRRAAGAGGARRPGRGGRRGATGRSGRSRCSRRSGAASRDAPAARASCAWSMPRQLELVEQVRRASGPSEPSRRRRHTTLAEPSRPSGAGGTATAPMLSCGPTCRPASRGGSAIGAASDAGGRAALHRPPSRSSRSRSSSSGLLALVAGGRDRSSPPRLQLLQPGPARPARHPEQPRVRPADHRSTTGPARSSWPSSASSSASSSRYDQIPPEMLDATTAIEDKDFWTNPGFDVAGFVSADARHPERPSPRRLDDHPAARPGPPPAGRAFEGTREERKIREIIQSLRLTQAYPGRGGQAGDHHRLPQPELLRQPELRHRGRRPDVLQQEPQGPDPRPGGDPRRDPPVADDVRPRQERRGGLLDDGQRGRDDCPSKIQLVVPRHVRDLQAPQLRPRADEDPQPAVRREAHGRRVRGREDRAGRPRSAARRPLAGPALRLAGPQRARHDPLPGRPDRPVQRHRHRRLPGHDDARLEDAGDDREVALRGGPGAEHCRTTPDHPQEPEDPGQGLGLDPEPQGQEHQQRRRRRSWTTGPARSSPMPGRPATPPGHEEVPAEVRRPLGRLAPARLIDQADQLRDRHRGPDDDRRDDVHGRHDRLRRQVHPDPGRQGASAARSASGRPSSSR